MRGAYFPEAEKTLRWSIFACGFNEKGAKQPVHIRFPLLVDLEAYETRSAEPETHLVEERAPGPWV